MGGKPKQAQRTKGNLKPSKSSNFTAEPSSLLGFANVDSPLLQSSLVGFGVEEIVEIDPNIDQSFQVVLRKMSKKDPTTKIKALKEFIDLTNEADLDVVLSAIQMYAKMYIQLSTEVDARVREGAQNSLQAVVNKIGKNLATILKQIFPSWICSQYDTFPTAASVAKNCFNKAFPPNKVSEVFSFCESEILESFTKNLTILNSQTICNNKMYSPEECEAKYERVVIGSLRGYIHYLEKIPSERIEKTVDKNVAFIAHDKFWSFHKNKSPYVRAAFFETLTAILQYAPFLMKNLEPQLASTVFKMLDETDPSVLSHIWTSILLVQLKVDDWYKHINLQKSFFPKLAKILKTSLYPSIIYPNLLPMISKFNKSVMSEEELQAFYMKFFENINEGMRNVKMSKSELNVVASTYFEILQFVIIQIINDEAQSDDEKITRVNNLMDDHIIAVIFWCINTDSLFGRVIFGKIAEIVKYWSRNVGTKEIYRRTFDRFWTELYQVLEGSLEGSSNLQQISNGHVELIKNLKTSSQPKSVKIKVDEETDLNEKSDVAAIAEKMKNVSFEEPLAELVHKLSLSYVEKINTTLDKALVENLDLLIKEYQSKELFKHLASNQQDKSICSLYDTFADWLQNEELKCEAVIEIILALYKYLEPSEKIDLLNRWIRIPTIQKSWLIMRALSYPLCCDIGITKFLKMKEVTDYLSECAMNVSLGAYKDLIILQKCFFQTENGDILIDNDTCSSIVDIICSALIDPQKINQADQCSSFLAQIFSTICSDPSKKDIQLKIFLSLFEFSITMDVCDNLSEDTMWEITTAWQDALSSGDLEMNDELLWQCSKIIDEKLKNLSMKTTSFENMERYAELVSKLVICSNEDKQGSERDEAINSMLKCLLDKQDRLSEQYLEDICVSLEALRADYTFDKRGPTDCFKNMNFDHALDVALKYQIFNLNVILMLSCNIKKKSAAEQKGYDDESENENDEIEYAEMKKQEMQEEEITEDYCDLNENLLKEWKGVIINKFLDISKCKTIFNMFLSHMKKINGELENWIIYMDERLAILVENVSEMIQKEIQASLFEQAASIGGLYIQCLVILLQSKKYNSENGKAQLFDDVMKLLNAEEATLAHVNILQTFEGILDRKSLSITQNLAEKCFNLLLKTSASCVIMKNNLAVADYNEMDDRKVVGHGLILMNEIITRNKENAFLLYNKDVSLEDPQNVLTVASIANFLSDCLKYFPTEIDVLRWDFVRIALSSWVLSVSKSSEKFDNEVVKNFIVAIYRLNASLQKFIIAEKTKSSTQSMTNMIDEWENIFAKDVNLVLIKSFIYIVKNIDYSSKYHEVFVDALCPHIEFIDFSYVLPGKKIDHTFSLNDLVEFSLENLSSKHIGISITAATIIRQLTDGFLKMDQETLNKRSSEDYNESDDDEDSLDSNRWHILESFRDTLESYQEIMKELSEDFSFKANDLDDDLKIPLEVALPYLLLWHCILNFCSRAKPELRSVYARWISINRYEDVFLFSLFKMMPREILKSPDISTKLGHATFAPLKWTEIQESNIGIERYSSFLYAESLRVVPAIIRKWWHASNPRQAQVIDKITANYVSPILCNEDLTVLTTMKEREGRSSINIRVLMQAREVIATYSLEDAKMELVICLPQNYPLGAIKVDCKKHIGGKFQAREIVKQLSIYLTHQNGRLYDGVNIWKRNLDGKYEGVEECYVCYAVIHQENLQLPKIICKTCKKKFHSSCLYRWFTSSNKSTCPLCRNPF